MDRVAVNDLQVGTESNYEQMIADSPELADETIEFQVTGGAIGVGSNHIPYPESDDWQKAIGGHSIWSSATVTVTPGDNGDPPAFEMAMTLHGTVKIDIILTTIKTTSKPTRRTQSAVDLSRSARPINTIILAS